MTLEKPDLSGKTAFITGTTRGIGKAIALALAECGCNVVSTGKTTEKGEYGAEKGLEGTIEETARECEAFGVEALATELNVRENESVETAARAAIDRFGGIDIVINNASAIELATVEELPPDRFDLLCEVNVRGTYLVARAFVDHLENRAGDAWFLTNAPPISIDRAPGKAAYAYSKQGMTFLTLSLAGELSGVGCNCFWPVTAIDTRATRYFGLGTEDDWRSTEIVSDAVLEILRRDPTEYTGTARYDEELLAEAGLENFSRYNLTEGDPEPISARLFDPDYERPE